MYKITKKFNEMFIDLIQSSPLEYVNINQRG